MAISLCQLALTEVELSLNIIYSFVFKELAHGPFWILTSLGNVLMGLRQKAHFAPAYVTTPTPKLFSKYREPEMESWIQVHLDTSFHSTGCFWPPMVLLGSRAAHTTNT